REYARGPAKSGWIPGMWASSTLRQRAQGPGLSSYRRPNRRRGGAIVLELGKRSQNRPRSVTRVVNGAGHSTDDDPLRTADITRHGGRERRELRRRNRTQGLYCAFHLPP